jgi:hypothetical protein
VNASAIAIDTEKNAIATSNSFIWPCSDSNSLWPEPTYSDGCVALTPVILPLPDGVPNLQHLPRGCLDLDQMGSNAVLLNRHWKATP